MLHKLLDVLFPKKCVFCGGVLDIGPYEYYLFRGGLDGITNLDDYFLRSTGPEGPPTPTNVFRTMMNIPSIHLVMADTGMNSLQRRMGNLRDFGNVRDQAGIWTRTFIKKITVDDLIATDMNLFGVEAGYDWLFNPADPNRVYFGVMLGYMKTNSISTTLDNGGSGSGNGSAPSIGAYATIMNEKNWFVDIAARNFWTSIDMTNTAAGGTLLSYSPKRDVFAASVEAGKSFRDSAGGGLYTFEPKVELQYARAFAGSTGVTNGTGNLSYGATNSLSAKTALFLGYIGKASTGQIYQPFVELAYKHEFDGRTDVTYGAATLRNNLSGGTISGAVGANLQMADSVYIYMQGSYENGRKIEALGGNLGLRLSFGGGGSSAAPAPARQSSVNGNRTAPPATTPSVRMERPRGPLIY